VLDHPPSIVLVDASGPDETRLRRLRLDGTPLWETVLASTTAIDPADGRVVRTREVL